MSGTSMMRPGSVDPNDESGGGGSQSGLRLRYTIFSDNTTNNNQKWLVLNLKDLPDNLEQENLIYALAKKVQEDNADEQIKNDNIVAFDLGATVFDNLENTLKEIIVEQSGLEENKVNLIKIETPAQLKNTHLETIEEGDEEEETNISFSMPSQPLTADNLEKKLHKEFLAPAKDLTQTEQPSPAPLPTIETGEENDDNKDNKDNNETNAPKSGFDAPPAKTDKPEKEKKQEDAGLWALIFMALTHRVVMIPITQFILKPLAGVGSFGYGILTGTIGAAYLAASVALKNDTYEKNAQELFATSAKYDGTFTMFANLFKAAILSYQLGNKGLNEQDKKNLLEAYNTNKEELDKNFTNSIFNKLTGGYMPKVVVDTAKVLVKSAVAPFRIMYAGMKFLNNKRNNKPDASKEFNDTTKEILKGIISGTFVDYKVNHGKPLAYLYYDFFMPYNPAPGGELAFDNSMNKLASLGPGWASVFGEDKNQNIYRILKNGYDLDLGIVNNGEKVVKKDNKADEAVDNKTEDNKLENSKDNKSGTPKIEVTTQPGNSLTESEDAGVTPPTIGVSTASAAPELVSSASASASELSSGTPLGNAFAKMSKNAVDDLPLRVGDVANTSGSMNTVLAFTPRSFTPYHDSNNSSVPSLQASAINKPANAVNEQDTTRAADQPTQRSKL